LRSFSEIDELQERIARPHSGAGPGPAARLAFVDAAPNAVAHLDIDGNQNRTTMPADSSVTSSTSEMS
jgi:hypothetical protein